MFWSLGRRSVTSSSSHAVLRMEQTHTCVFPAGKRPCAPCDRPLYLRGTDGCVADGRISAFGYYLLSETMVKKNWFHNLLVSSFPSVCVHDLKPLILSFFWFETVGLDSGSVPFHPSPLCWIKDIPGTPFKWRTVRYFPECLVNLWLWWQNANFFPVIQIFKWSQPSCSCLILFQWITVVFFEINPYRYADVSVAI